MRTFNLPDLGEGLSEAEIVNWHVSAGDRVVADQPLVSVETDKAVVEVPSPFTGNGGGTARKTGRNHPDRQGRLRISTTPACMRTRARSSAACRNRKAPRLPRPRVKRRRARTCGRCRQCAHWQRSWASISLPWMARDRAGRSSPMTSTASPAAMSDAGPPKPLHGVRRAMAQKMEQSHAEIVPASVYDEADVEAWLDGGDVTVRLIRAISGGLQNLAHAECLVQRT